MATKKAAAGKSTSIVKWTEKFAVYTKETKEQTANIGSGGISIKFGRGSVTVGDNQIKGGKLECVIVGSCALNAWYGTDYDPNDRQPPDCYAFAIVNDDPEMAPHASASNKQAEKCSECEKNVFGSAKTGRGKACSNNIRIGVLTAKDVEDTEGIATAELATGKISPTNLVHYKKYVDNVIEEYGRPPWAVVTEVSSHDDPKTQIRLEFRMVSLIEDDEALEALEKRYLKIQDVLQKPFAAPTEKPAAKKPAAGASKKFAPVAKKTTRK